MAEIWTQIGFSWLNKKCRKAEDCLPMKGHTRGGEAPTVLPIERKQRGGRTHNVTQRTDTHIFRP